MKRILSVNDVRLSDTQTIQSGIPSKELMYRAALGVYNSYTWKGTIGIFCGSGNNAGDGYALAIILQENGYNPELILLYDKFSEDGLYYYEKCCLPATRGTYGNHRLIGTQRQTAGL